MTVDLIADGLAEQDSWKKKEFIMDINSKNIFEIVADNTLNCILFFQDNKEIFQN